MAIRPERNEALLSPELWVRPCALGFSAAILWQRYPYILLPIPEFLSARTLACQIRTSTDCRHPV